MERISDGASIARAQENRRSDATERQGWMDARGGAFLNLNLSHDSIGGTRAIGEGGGTGMGLELTVIVCDAS